MMEKQEKPGPATSLTTTDLVRKIEVTTQAGLGAIRAIDTDDDYALVGRQLQAVVALEREVASTFDPIIKRQREALEVAREQKARHMAPLTEAERQIKAAMARWIDARRTPTIEESVAVPAEELLDRPAPRAEAVASVREAWKHEVTASGLLRPDYLIPNATKIGQVVRALGDAAVEAVSLPGKTAIRVWKETVIAAKRTTATPLQREDDPFGR